MRIRTPRELGRVIREHRKRAGLDQAELAERADVSRQWIVEVERGHPRAELGLVLRTLNALELDLWLGELPGAERDTEHDVDIDALVDRARGIAPE